MKTVTKLGVLAAILTTGAACQAVSATNAHETSAQGACSIETRSLSGTNELSGVARGIEGDTGHYRLTVKGGDGRNSTSTSQGGGFTVDSNGEARTGTVRLSTKGVYDADMRVSIGGQTFSCSKRIGTHI